ncbi:MAG: hypothetical protein AAGL98_13660 [Planctomycetota bacterium]
MPPPPEKTSPPEDVAAAKGSTPAETTSPGAPDAPRPFERVFSVFVGAFLGGLVGLFLGIGLACFGLTMWLWLVIPLTTATIGGVIGIKKPIDLDE